MRVHGWLSFLVIAVGTFVGLAGCAHAQTGEEWHDQAPSEAGPDLQVEAFYDPLSPYGEWIEVGGLGRVWRPYPEEVGPQFRPYATGGHWVYTTAGWTFASSYAWGWGPFHYGHWWFEPTYGWVWLPGSRWAPAWVEWRYGGGYVGWAPVAPPGFHFSFEATWGSPWSFVETRFISQPVVTTYVVPVSRVRTIYTVTQSAPLRSAGRTYYSAGPSAAHVTSVVGTPVRPVPVERVERAVPPDSHRYQPSERVPPRAERPARPSDVSPAYRSRRDEPSRPREWNTHPTGEREVMQRPGPVNGSRANTEAPRVLHAPPTPSIRNAPNQLQPQMNRPAVRAGPASIPHHVGGRGFPGGGRAR